MHSNIIQSNTGTGVIFYTDSNYLSENTISDSTDYALKFFNDKYYNYIYRNNTANGEEINYYYNENGITIQSKTLSASKVSNVGKITLINCQNITVQDNALSNNALSGGHGIFLWGSNNIDLINNDISSNDNGVRLYSSSNNDITDLDTINPSAQYGMKFDTNSDYNTITNSIIDATSSYGLTISTSDHTTITNTDISSSSGQGVSLSSSANTTITNTRISSSDQGVSASDSQYATLTNVTIISASNDGASLTSSHNANIIESNITANNRGVYCINTSNINIINTIIKGTNGIEMRLSNWGNLTGNTINATQKGVFLYTSRNHNLTSNDITDYTNIGVLLEEYSTNTSMIGNDLTRNGAEFDIRINDSNDAVITNNELNAANYTFYLTNDTRLVTLDTEFNKTKVGYEDTSNLTIMWRIDVLAWDIYHKEEIWANLTVRYGDYTSGGGEPLLWEGELPLSKNGRLTGKEFDDYDPPNLTNYGLWVPIIEYKQNVSMKNLYQPMNCTTINRWDKLMGINRSYRNISALVTGRGMTIHVDSGFTPNGKCYYCHDDKIIFKNTKHWDNYTARVFNDTEDPYTPGRCIDCHDENDSISIPHGTESGKDLLYQPSPQLCYTGRTGDQDCHSENATQSRLDQETEFNQTSAHPVGDGKLACKACHDNHGTEYPKDLLKNYRESTSGGYNSDYYALCLVCHLEEKIVAKMDDTDSHLRNYTNQTNFRDEYYASFSGGFGDGTPILHNYHSPQKQNWNDGFHSGYNCYTCHSPHGSGNPRMTRFTAKNNGIFNYTYITNLTPPNAGEPEGNWSFWEVLDQAKWSDSTMNQAGGLYNSGCGCHSFISLQSDTPSFNYRQPFVNYTPAGGAGCVECHDSARPDAIRPIVNVSAIELAMHQNLSRTFREGGILPGTDKTLTEWLQYREYTAEQITNISTDNAICWSCHSTNGTPPDPGFHPDRALNPYKCPKCHGPIDGQPPHTAGLVKAIDNHGPTTKGGGSVSIQTSVGKNGSCGDCHAPSVLPTSYIGEFKVWKWGSGSSGYTDNWRTFTGTTTMGNVSHYGLNRSQGEGIIANPLVNTSDCLFCHTNSINGAIWGNAMNVSGNMYGADTNNVSECYTYCHLLPDYLSDVNETNIAHFHNRSIYSGGGPDCVVCHDVNGPYHVQSLVNATSIAQGIHGNVTNNSFELIPNIDPRSKPCWGCHQSDSKMPEGMGDRNGIVDPTKKPWTCEDCHIRSNEWVAATSDGETWLSSSYPPNKLPPRIYTHHPNSSTVKTNVSGGGRCVDCHNNSIDPYHYDTSELVLGNTIFSNVSHYGLSKSNGTALGISNPLFNTSECGICHNSTVNATIWGNATQNGHGNFDDYSAEDGCYACHTTDDQTPSDFHAEEISSGEGGFDCLQCHNDSGFSKYRRINGSIFGEAIHKDVNNASTMEYGLNRSCWACHFENGLNADNHSSLKDPEYLCYDCHNKVGGPFSNVSGAPKIYNHFKSGTSVQAYWERLTDSDSCMSCHNQSEMFYFYLPDENETDPYYTNFSITSHYGSNRTDIVDLYSESNTRDYCKYCHKNASTPFTLYYNWVNHESSNCQNCHGAGRLHSNNLTPVSTSGNCVNCHGDYVEGPSMISQYIINVTAMNLGVHANVNSNMTSVAIAETSDPNNSKCWGCHVLGGAYPEEGHENTFNNDAYLCYECHNSTAKAYVNVSSAPAVYNHFKTGDNISANNAADSISESCGYGCHNLSSMKVPSFEGTVGQSSYRVNLSQASHYAKNRTDDIVLSDDLSDCTWCHRNSTNEFIDIFERNGSPNYTENISHSTQIESCIIADCHKRGRIHDENLTIPTWEWDEQCKDCHYNLNGSAFQEYYVNETMFNQAVHWNLNCTLCHVYIADQPATWHPIAEYYWKWCEDCHVVQSDPINDTDRHNVTFDPWNYTIGGTSVVYITDCTVCHNATIYNASVDNYETNKCRYCHEYADKGNKTSQDWY